METYYYWFIAALALVAVEMFTAGFAVVCFAIGCAAAGIAAACGAGLNGQLIAAIAASILSFVLVRPLMLKYFSRRDKDVPTNADALIGRIGTVSETIDTSAGIGRVAIDGDDWKAVSSTLIPRGTHVRVVSRDSIILTVEETEQAHIHHH